MEPNAARTRRRRAALRTNHTRAALADPCRPAAARNACAGDTGARQRARVFPQRRVARVRTACTRGVPGWAFEGGNVCLCGPAAPLWSSPKNAGRAADVLDCARTGVGRLVGGGASGHHRREGPGNQLHVWNVRPRRSPRVQAARQPGESYQGAGIRLHRSSR